MPLRLSSSLSTLVALSLFALAATPCHSLAETDTAEMFQVGQVGQRGAAETREVLGIIYRDIAANYDAQRKADLAAKGPKQTFKGERITILKPLEKDNPDGDLYLCAYDGAPSVFQISGKKLSGGKLSPPLANVTPAGDHTTVITRTVKDPQANPGSDPALRKVDTNSGAGVTFFGIPLGPTSDSKPKDKAKNKAKGSSSTGTKEVQEKRTMPKFTAAISTEKSDEGPPPMSQSLFLSMVKNGEIFTVENQEQRRCQNCRGFGKVTDTRPPGKRSPDGKMDCAECSGAGKILWNVTYKVGW